MKARVPHGPVVSGPTFAIPFGAAAPGNALPTPYPRPPVPMRSGETGDLSGRLAPMRVSPSRKPVSGFAAASEAASTAASRSARSGAGEDEQARGPATIAIAPRDLVRTRMTFITLPRSY